MERGLVAKLNEQAENRDPLPPDRLLAAYARHDTRALARLITAIQRQQASHAWQVPPGKAIVLGITGSPGVGKSSIIGQLGVSSVNAAKSGGGRDGPVQSRCSRRDPHWAIGCWMMPGKPDDIFSSQSLLPAHSKAGWHVLSASGECTRGLWLRCRRSVETVGGDKRTSPSTILLHMSCCC